MTITIELPEDAQSRLEAEAARRGITLARLIADLAGQFPDDTLPPQRRLAFLGAGASKAGITHQIDELLAKGFGRD